MNSLLLFALPGLAALAVVTGALLAQVAIQSAPDGEEDWQGFHPTPATEGPTSARNSPQSAPAALVC